MGHMDLSSKGSHNMDRKGKIDNPLDNIRVAYNILI